MKITDKFPYDYATNDFDLGKDIDKQKSEVIKYLVENLKKIPIVQLTEKK